MPDSPATNESHDETPVKGRPVLSRRALLRGAVVVGVSAVAASTWAFTSVGKAFYGGPEMADAPGVEGTRWRFAPQNPVLDVVPNSWESHAVFDCCVARVASGALWMWYSGRGANYDIGLAIDTSGSGDLWQRQSRQPVLSATPPESGYPYESITRPSVVATPQGWRMWYSTMAQDAAPAGLAWIGTALSTDGAHWQKHGAPLLAPREPWEKQALQCPNVLYDATDGIFKMWYCGGDLYEPDAVGYATSRDGVTWRRFSPDPIFTPTRAGWDSYKIGSFQVHQVGGWYYAFYNAFQQTPFVSQIGMARSRDGVTNWERHPANPIISPQPGEWDAAMVYKPTALWNDARGRWDVWFNASAQLNHTERIGHAWYDQIW